MLKRKQNSRVQINNQNAKNQGGQIIIDYFLAKEEQSLGVQF